MAELKNKEENKENLTAKQPVVSDSPSSDISSLDIQSISISIETKPLEKVEIVENKSTDKADKLNPAQSNIPSQTKTVSEKEEKIDKEVETEKKADNSKPIISSIAWPRNFKNLTSILQSKLEKIQNRFKKTNAFNSPEVLEMNLVKDKASVFLNWRKHLLITLLFVFFSFLLVGEMYIGLTWMEKRSYDDIVSASDRSQEIDKQIKEIKPLANEGLAFKKKMDLVKKIVVNHVYWTNFFDFLENNTLSNVYYPSGINGNIRGTYSLQAKTDDYQAISAQTEAFLNNSFVVNAGVGDSGVRNVNQNNPVRGSQINMPVNTPNNIPGQINGVAGQDNTPNSIPGSMAADTTNVAVAEDGSGVSFILNLVLRSDLFRQ